MSEKQRDKGLYTCPNNHLYNANKYGNICPNCGAKQEDKKKTLEEYEAELKLSPEEWVCGFLVCIEGINKGRAYSIKGGKRFIGSDPNMDIYIKGDPGIEPVNHAVIMYDSKTRETKLLAGISKGMVYLENKAVFMPIVLEPFDILELGNSKFQYTPFCSETWDWADLSKDL